MREKARLISESAFRHRVAEAAYYRARLRWTPFGNAKGDPESDWMSAEWDQRQFLFFYNIRVVPDEWFDEFVRVVAHGIWRREYDDRMEAARNEAKSQLVEALGREPERVELYRKTHEVYERHGHRDSKSDWRRARYEISGGLDVRGPWDGLHIASMVVVPVSTSAAA